MELENKENLFKDISKTLNFEISILSSKDRYNLLYEMNINFVERFRTINTSYLLTKTYF